MKIKVRKITNPNTKKEEQNQTMEKSKINAGDFAMKYARCGNVYESAIYAGASRRTAAADGLRMLCVKSVRKRIRELRHTSDECKAEQALRRIAFGRINDAVRLAFAEEVTPEMIEQADLYNVSEIKKVKGGGVEIKFFDRQRAAERIIECENRRDSSTNAENLISAIYGEGEEE